MKYLIMFIMCVLISFTIDYNCDSDFKNRVDAHIEKKHMKDSLDRNNKLIKDSLEIEILKQKLNKN